MDPGFTPSIHRSGPSPRGRAGEEVGPPTPGNPPLTNPPRRGQRTVGGPNLVRGAGPVMTRRNPLPAVIITPAGRDRHRLRRRTLVCTTVPSSKVDSERA